MCDIGADSLSFIAILPLYSAVEIRFGLEPLPCGDFDADEDGTAASLDSLENKDKTAVLIPTDFLLTR